MDRQEKWQLAYDIMMARKYKKQIIAANIAGTGLILVCNWIAWRREEAAYRRRYKDLQEK